jgi:hypothetical protein
MVDFVAVIEKAVDGLSENSPEMRVKVYDKARAAIGRQLDNIDPPLSDAVKDKQLEKLEDAIAEVEDRNTEALPGLDEDVFADIFADAPDDEDPGLGSHADTYVDPRSQRPFEPAHGPEMDGGRGYGDSNYDEFGIDGGVAPDQPRMGGQNAQDYFEPPKSQTGRTVIIAAVAFVLIAGAGIGVWSLRDQIGNLISSSPQPGESTSVVMTEDVPAEDTTGLSGSGQNSNADGGGVSGAGALQSGLSDQQKFTQRLLEDGSEVDAGPAAGAETPATEEGKSVAAIDNTPPVAEQPVSGDGTSGTSAAEPPAIGQKMFLYEERLGQQAPTAEEGRVVWSIVRESPGEDLPPEPAIQADIDLPNKGISAILTIKRNADPSLPASHLIEIVFALTDAFEGSGIKSIQNFAMKQTEQDTGDSLIAVPAKITDSFFMIALNDYVEAVQLNLKLMRERNWIDLPVAYGNGRRALLTLEKGSTGAEVFDQVIRAWEARAVSSQ